MQRAQVGVRQHNRLRILAVACLALLLSAAPGTAQSDAARYPSQLVRIVVPVSPGSIADGFARVIAERLSDIWKQQVIVENRPGLPGTLSVAKSQPDGYTLLLNSNGHTIASAISKNLSFDPVKDFSGIAQVASVPLAMIVPPTSAAKSVPDFIRLAKDKPGQLNFASAGVSTTSFLSGEIFRQKADIDIVHVPFRGAPEAVTAVVRGDAQMYFAPIPSAQELSAAGKVRMIAVNSASRAPQIPDVPTIAESGLRDYEYDSWFGLLAPAGTPRAIIGKLSQDIATAVRSDAVREYMQKQGAVPVATSPERFDGILRAETDRNLEILRRAGISPN